MHNITVRVNGDGPLEAKPSECPLMVCKKLTVSRVRPLSLGHLVNPEFQFQYVGTPLQAFGADLLKLKLQMRPLDKGRFAG